MRRSCLTSKFVRVVLEASMYFSGIRNDSSLGEWSLTLGSMWWRYMKFPDMDQKSFLHRHPEVSLEVVEEETLLVLQENLFDFLLELGGPVSRWVLSVPDLFQKDWFVHLRLENEISIFFGKCYFLCIESLRVDFWCVHRFQHLNVCNQYVALPNSPRVQSVSKEQSR